MAMHLSISPFFGQILLCYIYIESMLLGTKN